MVFDVLYGQVLIRIVFARTAIEKLIPKVTILVESGGQKCEVHGGHVVDTKSRSAIL